MKLFTTRLLTPREQHRSQYFTVTSGEAEVCRTDSLGKAERIARALALLEQLEAAEAAAHPADPARPTPSLPTAAD